MKCDEEATSQKPIVKGQNIGSIVLEMLKSHSLDLKNFVGIPTGG